MIYAIYGIALFTEFCGIIDYFLHSPEIKNRVLKAILSILGVFILSSILLLLGL